MLGYYRKGGYIRWYYLVIEEKMFSSDFRSGCWNTYIVSVGIEVISSLFALTQPLIVGFRNLV